jgi:hypothetical protein
VEACSATRAETGSEQMGQGEKWRGSERQRAMAQEQGHGRGQAHAHGARCTVDSLSLALMPYTLHPTDCAYLRGGQEGQRGAARGDHASVPRCVPLALARAH